MAWIYRIIYANKLNNLHYKNETEFDKEKEILKRIQTETKVFKNLTQLKNSVESLTSRMDWIQDRR